MGTSSHKVSLEFLLKLAPPSLKRLLQVLCKNENVRKEGTAVLHVVYETKAEEGHFRRIKDRRKTRFLLDKKINMNYVVIIVKKDVFWW